MANKYTIQLLCEEHDDTHYVKVTAHCREDSIDKAVEKHQQECGMWCNPEPFSTYEGWESRYRIYEGYRVSPNGVLELEDHSDNYVVTEDELVERFVESTLELQGDTEDTMREWLISQPEIGDILHGHPSDLPIKRIS